MIEKEIEFVKTQLSVKNKGKLRRMFYQKNGLPKQGLYSNLQILKKLNISELNPNTLESEGITRNLGVSLAMLRKQAKTSNLPWIDLNIKGKAQHGFSEDIDKISDNADKFETIATQHKTIAKTTRKIAEIQRKLLTA